MSDTLFDLVTLCPQCNGENVVAHTQTVIEGGILERNCKWYKTGIVSYHCDDCLTWFAPEEGVVA